MTLRIRCKGERTKFKPYLKLSMNKEFPKFNPIKRSRGPKRKLHACHHHPQNQPVLHLPQISLIQRLFWYPRITIHLHLAALKTSVHTSLHASPHISLKFIAIKHLSKAKFTIQFLTVPVRKQLIICDLK